MKIHMNHTPIFNLPKNLFRVLVFPSCNEPGLEIIHALLKNNKVEVFGGSSIDPKFDPSRQLLTNYLKLPSLYDQDFREKFLEILDTYDITHVFPSVDVLVTEFASWKVRQVKFIVPPLETAKLAGNKEELYKTLGQYLPVPTIFDTITNHDSSFPFPVFAKPPTGSGCQDSSIIHNDKELAVALHKKLLIHEYLPGEEYTVDAINDLKGNLLFGSPRLRGKIGRSIALGTQTSADPELLKLMELISQHLKIIGPWFAQFKRDKNNVLKLLEINCRIGGSSTLTRLSGINIPLLSVFLYSGYPIKVPSKQPPIVLNRFLTNMCDPVEITDVIWDLDDTLIRKDDKVDPESVLYLYDFYNRGIKQHLITRKPNPQKLLLTYHLPVDFFITINSSEDKAEIIKNIIHQYKRDESKIAVINDSVIENFTISQQLPKIRIVTPDSLASLGKEKVK